MTTFAESIAVDALVFDAYGTLFDVQSVTALAEALAPGRGAALAQLWRSKQLEYTWLSSLMATPAFARADFRATTRYALDYAVAALSISLAQGDHERLVDAYRTLAPFPDAGETLAALAPRPRWILSNGTLAMLAPLVASSGFAQQIDGVLSVDAVDIYKPSPRVYQLAVDALKVPPARIGFVSANSWDAVGAKAFGFRTFWINRAAAPVDRHGPAPDRELRALAELPPLLEGTH